MSDMMKEDLWELFEALGVDQTTNEEREAKKYATQAVVDALEAKYADRGLQFTANPHGACPVQAYGRFDGLRFYFRFRSNWASLRMGPVVPEFEQKYADRQSEAYRKHLQERNDEFSQRHYERQIAENRPQTEEDAEFYPHIVSRASGTEGPTPGDVYNGWLSDDEFAVIFSRLVDTLDDIHEDEQIDTFTKKWLNPEDSTL